MEEAVRKLTTGQAAYHRRFQVRGKRGGVRVRVERMGSILTRTGWDSPTFLHVFDPVIFTRTRSSALPGAGHRCFLSAASGAAGRARQGGGGAAGAGGGA
eukprot:COSAG01_NODE_2384_length_7788_cov_8.398751_9_plen_100_part_00